MLHSGLEGVTPLGVGVLPIPRMTGAMSRVPVTLILAVGLIFISCLGENELLLLRNALADIPQGVEGSVFWPLAPHPDFADVDWNRIADVERELEDAQGRGDV